MSVLRAVMESEWQSHLLGGLEHGMQFAVSVTVADVIVKDGVSLEHTGVIPDEKLLPTAIDLAENGDPVLARAVEELGGKLSPEEAGKLFREKWLQW